MLDAILKRRSIRFYRNEDITDAQVEEVLKAGFCAPSAHGTSPWHAIVIRDQEIKDELSTMHKWTKSIARVPVVIVVCVDDTALENFWVEDGSAFMQNMLIQATDLGLGTCWIGIKGLVSEDRSAENIVKKACKIPDNMRVLGITPLGVIGRYPGEHEPVLPVSRVHYDVVKDSD